jgi:uncharacterized membrane protein YeaQ/YmgE (transglycosylase-associated protein family)
MEHGIIFTIVIGLVAGFLARFIMPGPNNPTGFIMTCLLGVAGAFLATFLGQKIGWYGPGQGARFIGATVGAIIILSVYNFIARSTPNSSL